MKRVPILYNVIFPIWMAIFIPPFTLIPLLGNLLIDGSVIYLTLKRNGVVLDGGKLRKLILQAWVMGFVVDLIGVGLLFLLNDVLYRFFAIEIDFFWVWKDPVSVIVLALIVAVCGTLIFMVNRWLARRAGVVEPAAFRVGLAMGIITAPYLFLVPTGYLMI
ncbi:hypothetical protein [Polycladomyces subterraneus]|uniref:Uncharacterized protein n=1 Tax=Polycladomyces subterraneus TaxID=1016997 RepID=A0ABT8IRH4_9BACL|nr:hypothetical protein [Polycladomyces subterraneus]MDN4595406.1 hypothetical protein [Polycladomyces subterraneus]